MKGAQFWASAPSKNDFEGPQKWVPLESKVGPRERPGFGPLFFQKKATVTSLCVTCPNYSPSITMLAAKKGEVEGLHVPFPLLRFESSKPRNPLASCCFSHIIRFDPSYLLDPPLKEVFRFCWRLLQNLAFNLAVLIGHSSKVPPSGHA